MNGRSASITASDGGEFSGYLTLPTSAKAPGGVVIIQEIFGVNDHIREVADEYAGERCPNAMAGSPWTATASAD
jgi:carboxymethylenebutenolidase